MKSFVRDDNKVLVVVLCALTVVMVGLIAGIALVNANRASEPVSGESQDGGSGGQSEGYMAGTTKPMGLDDNGEGENNSGGDGQDGGNVADDAERIQGWIAEAEDVRNGFDGMTLEDALAYIEQRAAEKDDPDDAFNIRLVKVNVLYYYEMYEEALAELKRVERPEDLTLWNQEEYYNMMYMVSLELGDEEAAGEYAKLWREVNYKRTGGPTGVED